MYMPHLKDRLDDLAKKAVDNDDRTKPVKVRLQSMCADMTDPDIIGLYATHYLNNTDPKRIYTNGGLTGRGHYVLRKAHDEQTLYKTLSYLWNDTTIQQTFGTIDQIMAHYANDVYRVSTLISVRDKKTRYKVGEVYRDEAIRRFWQEELLAYMLTAFDPDQTSNFMERGFLSNALGTAIKANVFSMRGGYCPIGEKIQRILEQTPGFNPITGEWQIMGKRPLGLFLGIRDYLKAHENSRISTYKPCTLAAF